MPSATTLGSFLALTAAIMLIPGPTVLFAVARTLEGGRRAGLVTVLGLESGLLVHVTAATVGLSALLAASETALHVIRLAGAGYLLHLAWRQLRTLRHLTGAAPTSGSRLVPVAAGARTRTALFLDGCVVDVLNPKTVLFFVAFLPQFVEPARGSELGQLVVLGLLAVVLGLVCDGGYVVLAARLTRRAGSPVLGGSSGRTGRRIALVTGVSYAGLAAATVLVA
jgi:threonine/homoserine/homoserine lactone efflux protein